MLRTIPLTATKTVQEFLSDHGIGFLAIENKQISKIDKNFRKT